MEPYFDLFNKLFFFNKLQAPHCRWDFIQREDMPYSLREYSGYATDERDYALPTPVLSSIYINDVIGQSHEITRYMVVHEMLHSFFFLHCCRCGPDCQKAFQQDCGETGHGLAWLKAARAIADGLLILNTMSCFKHGRGFAAEQLEGSLAREIRTRASSRKYQLSKSELKKWDTRVEELMGKSLVEVQSFMKVDTKILARYYPLFDKWDRQDHGEEEVHVEIIDRLMKWFFDRRSIG